MGTQPTTRNSDGSDEAFFRAITFPEEDRRQYTSAAWSGGFRWFRLRNGDATTVSTNKRAVCFPRFLTLLCRKWARARSLRSMPPT
jgi:hypothetical protein